jgi:hypothetical protein
MVAASKGVVVAADSGGKTKTVTPHRARVLPRRPDGRSDGASFFHWDAGRHHAGLTPDRQVRRRRLHRRARCSPSGRAAATSHVTRKIVFGEEGKPGMNFEQPRWPKHLPPRGGAQHRDARARSAQDAPRSRDLGVRGRDPLLLPVLPRTAQQPSSSSSSARSIGYFAVGICGQAEILDRTHRPGRGDPRRVGCDAPLLPRLAHDRRRLGQPSSAFMGLLALRRSPSSGSTTSASPGVINRLQEAAGRVGDRARRHRGRAGDLRHAPRGRTSSTTSSTTRRPRRPSLRTSGGSGRPRGSPRGRGR